MKNLNYSAIERFLELLSWNLKVKITRKGHVRVFYAGRMSMTEYIVILKQHFIGIIFYLFYYIFCTWFNSPRSNSRQLFGR